MCEVMLMDGEGGAKVVKLSGVHHLQHAPQIASFTVVCMILLLYFIV